MKSDKEFRMRLYQVEMQGGQKFSDWLTRCMEIDDLKRLTKDRRSNPMRLQSLSKWPEKPQCFEGDIARIRTNEPAAIGNSNEKALKPAVDGTPGSGVTESTAFLYDGGLNILLLQSNRSGTSAEGFEKYFAAVMSSAVPFSLKPVIRPDTFERLRKMRDVRRCVVKIASPSKMGWAADEVDGISGAMDLCDAFDAPEIEIRLSAPPKPKRKKEREKDQGLAKPKLGLATSKVLDFVTKIFDKTKDNQHAVSELRVAGYEDDSDSMTPLDILDDTWKQKTSIQVYHDPEKHYAERRDCLRSLYQVNHQELERIYGPKPSETSPLH